MSEIHGEDDQCNACVTCACCAVPSVDEDGLCTACGGVPIATAEQYGTPHIGGAATHFERILIGEMLRAER